MSQDPRFQNKTFSPQSVRAYLDDYANTLHKCLESLPADQLEAAAQLLVQTRASGGRVFAAGNGGSAAIADHLGCDWQKGVHVPGTKCLKVHTLTSNAALLTAIANDFGYDKSFAFQLELADLEAKDLVVLISSSGNSANILQAARFARERGAKILGLCGFSGGQLKTAADVALHVPYDNYGVVEDAHQLIMHVLAQYHDVRQKKS